MSETRVKNKVRMRTVFISDVHLGSRGCRADLLHEFLKSVEVETLFLVGDIVDLWAMRKAFFWPQELWIPVPSDWKKNIVTGKGSSVDSAAGMALWSEVRARFRRAGSSREDSTSADQFGRAS